MNVPRQCVELRSTRSHGVKGVSPDSVLPEPTPRDWHPVARRARGILLSDRCSLGRWYDRPTLTVVSPKQPRITALLSRGWERWCERRISTLAPRASLFGVFVALAAFGCARQGTSSPPRGTAPSQPGGVAGGSNVLAEEVRDSENEDDFAELVAKARSAGSLEDFLHPSLGIYVVHNISGSVPHLDLLDEWPRDPESMIIAHVNFDDAITSFQEEANWELVRTGYDDNCEPVFGSIATNVDHTHGTLDIHLGMREDEEGEVTGPPWFEVEYEEVGGRLEGLSSDHVNGDWDSKKWKRFQTIHEAIQGAGTVVDQEFYVGSIDGEWYVLGIDATDPHCG